MFNIKKQVATHGIIFILLATLFLCLTVTVEAETTGAGYDTTNLDAAMAKYNIDYNNVITVENVDDLKTALTRAGSMASNGDRYIVHVVDGTYSISDSRTRVPANVLMVAESGACFQQTASANQMIKVAGSIYGGSYDGKYLAISVLYFDNINFSRNDGIIEKVTVCGGKKEGIIAMHSGCKNSQVLNSNISNCKENGICIQGDAHMKLISGCNTSNNNYSGINISHANVGIIENCVINNNGDKAVSTNSDPVSGYNQAGCTIDAIRNCTIKGNKTNGVYIKPKCTLKSFTGNKVIGNEDGLVASGKTARGTTGKSVIKNVSNNTFRGNKKSQICSGDKGAIIYIGKNNVVEKGKDNGIFVKAGATIKITGSGNVISTNKKAGIYIKEKSTLRITGSNNTIKSNKQAGISVDSSKVYITGKNTKIIKNSKQGIYARGKSLISAKSKVVKLTGNKKGTIYTAGAVKVKGIKK